MTDIVKLLEQCWMQVNSGKRIERPHLGSESDGMGCGCWPKGGRLHQGADFGERASDHWKRWPWPSRGPGVGL